MEEIFHFQEENLISKATSPHICLAPLISTVTSSHMWLPGLISVVATPDLSLARSIREQSRPEAPICPLIRRLRPPHTSIPAMISMARAPRIPNWLSQLKEHARHFSEATVTAKPRGESKDVGGVRSNQPPYDDACAGDIVIHRRERGMTQPILANRVHHCS
ncbi:MAG TPA: hypothetical protein VNI54_15520 [Thermoanaerobaculia bacterium]|nr:hypothetical protein [Thermoanaerobaculia bacterium]